MSAKYDINCDGLITTIAASDLSIGQLAVISVSGHPLSGHIVLRTYDGAVSLTDPEHTWYRDTSLQVIPLSSGTTITLTVS